MWYFYQNRQRPENQSKVLKYYITVSETMKSKILIQKTTKRAKVIRSNLYANCSKQKLCTIPMLYNPSCVMCKQVLPSIELQKLQIYYLVDRVPDIMNNEITEYRHVTIILYSKIHMPKL